MSDVDKIVEITENVEVASEEVVEETKNDVKKKKEKKPKKEKPAKEKKPKKEKEPKEKKTKKKMNPLIIIVLILLLVGAGFVALFPKIMSGDLPFMKTESFESGFVVDYSKNLFYNKYDVDVKFEDETLFTIKQGESKGYVANLEKGAYIVTFSEVNNPDNEMKALIYVGEGKTSSYKYSLKADWKGLEVSGDPTSISNCKAAAGTDAVETEEVEEEPVEEQAEAEAPAEEATEEE